MWVVFGSMCNPAGEWVKPLTMIAPPTLSLCHPAGKRQENNRLITVDTEADYTLGYHRFTQTLDKPMPSSPEKQIMGDSWL